MKALAKLNPYILKYKWRILLGVLFTAATNIFGVYAPQLINEAVRFLRKVGEGNAAVLKSQNGDISNLGLEVPASISWLGEVFGGSRFDLGAIQSRGDLLAFIAEIALLLGLLYLGVYLIKGLFLFFQRMTIIVMSRQVEYDLKNDIYAHYQSLSMAFYKRNNTGDLMNRISEDVSKVRMYLGPAIMYTVNLAVMISLVVAVMISIDVELTLYALSPLPFMSICIYYVSRIINKKSERVQKQQSWLSTRVQENMSGIRVLKAYNKLKHSENTFENDCDEYKTRKLDLVKVEALFMPIIIALVGLSTILTIYIGGMKVIAGELELEHIFQCVFYVNMLTWPFASVGWVTSLVQRAEASQRRINEFLETEPEIKNAQTAPQIIGGSIRFDEVSLVYPESGIKALDKVSFELEKGKTLAIIGRTGSGKSTIVNLISRQYDATEGQVLIDNQPIQDVNLDSLRRAMSIVPQEVFLFSESIEENIGFGLDGFEKEQIVTAAKNADVHHNIVDFPKGYDTLLGERGINLSGGQKQRISIARAIIAEPQILVFDDCLSAVDTETEENILNHLETIMKGKTTLLISHRVSTIKNADHILVMDDGKIIEQGSHDFLLESNGAYAEIHQKQLLEEMTE